MSRVAVMSLPSGESAHGVGQGKGRQNHSLGQEEEKVTLKCCGLQSPLLGCLLSGTGERVETETGGRHCHAWSLQVVRSADLLSQMSPSQSLPEAKEAFPSRAKLSVTSVCHYPVFHL